MKKIIVGITAFLVAAAFLTLFFWLTGFNFDRRGVDVAFWFFMSTIGCIFAAGFAAMWGHDQ